MAYNIKRESKTNKDIDYNNSSRRLGLLGSLNLTLKPLPPPLLLPYQSSSGLKMLLNL